MSLLGQFWIGFCIGLWTGTAAGLLIYSIVDMRRGR
jgi:hypothetical protein